MAGSRTYISPVYYNSQQLITIMISLKETSVNFLSTGYNQGSFSEEDATLFFTLVGSFPLFKQALICLLLLSYSVFSLSIVRALANSESGRVTTSSLSFNPSSWSDTCDKVSTLFVKPGICCSSRSKSVRVCKYLATRQFIFCRWW